MKLQEVLLKWAVEWTSDPGTVSIKNYFHTLGLYYSFFGISHDTVYYDRSSNNLGIERIHFGIYLFSIHLSFCLLAIRAPLKSCPFFRCLEDFALVAVLLALMVILAKIPKDIGILGCECSLFDSHASLPIKNIECFSSNT